MHNEAVTDFVFFLHIFADLDHGEGEFMTRDHLFLANVVTGQSRMVFTRHNDFDIGETDAVHIGTKGDFVGVRFLTGALGQIEIFESGGGELPGSGFIGEIVGHRFVILHLLRHPEDSFMKK